MIFFGELLRICYVIGLNILFFILEQYCPIFLSVQYLFDIKSLMKKSGGGFYLIYGILMSVERYINLEKTVRFLLYI